MSHLKNSLNDFLNTKKFVKKDKRSLSRNNSDRSLDNMKNSFASKKNYQNNEQSLTKRSKKYQDDEQDNFYDPREPKIRKVHSIEVAHESTYRKQMRNRRQESDEEEEYEVTHHHNYAQTPENFQSSKRQAKMFVEGLARKINIQIGNINNTIDEFNKNLKRTIDIEYSKLRAAIKNAVQEVFESEQDNMKKLAKMEERAVNQQLSDIRSELESMFSKLQKYKEGLDGSNWKKITGQLLSGDLESNVNDLIKRSEKMKMIKNVKMVLDPKKQQAFALALEQLLEVNLTGGYEQGHLGLVH